MEVFSERDLGIWRSACLPKCDFDHISAAMYCLVAETDMRWFYWRHSYRRRFPDCVLLDPVICDSTCAEAITNSFQWDGGTVISRTMLNRVAHLGEHTTDRFGRNDAREFLVQSPVEICQMVVFKSHQM